MISILPAHAQTADTGVGIAEFSGGGIFGLGAHGNVGGSLWVPTSKYAVPYIEFSYSPLTSYGFTYGVNDTGKGLFTSQLWDVNGGIKFRFPSKKRDWVPYVGLGVGLLRHSTSDYTSGFNSVATVNESTDEVAGNVSVGALYYVTRHVGFGMEAKGYFAAHNRVGRATISAFYQFP
ncbi:MAG: hypothetical protein ACLP59_12265 [Bryobacteraceae bacterium]